MELILLILTHFFAISSLFFATIENYQNDKLTAICFLGFIISSIAVVVVW